MQTTVRKSVLVLLFETLVAGAAPFQNLGFDAANTNNLMPAFPPSPYPNVDIGSGTTADLLPGWQMFSGTNAVTQNVWVNLNPAGLGLRSLYNRFNSPTPGPFAERYPVDGLYSFGMFPWAAIGEPYVPYTLSQVGEVPTDAQSLHFVIFGSPFELRLNDIVVPVTYDYGPEPQNPNTRRATALADVSAFAGQTVELRFITLDTGGIDTFINGIDSIVFVPVPEPGTGALVGGGLCLLAVGSWAQRKRACK
jgi:hypothetical protein